MSYIVFDLEFNQSYNSIKGTKNILASDCPFEIIQIGAVKIDENLETVSTMDILVKPVIYTELHPFLREMTSISMEQLDAAKNFREVYKEFIEFINEDSSILCVWGMADIKELFRNVEYHSLDISLIPRKYINLQSYASKYLKCPKGTNIGLQKAVKLLNIPPINKFHDAFNDAAYTAEIFRKIYNKRIKTSIYNHDKNLGVNRQNKKKQMVDTYRLIKQFEKMFNREMTEEEKSIIKLSYIMGKTNQFQIEDTEEFK